MMDELATLREEWAEPDKPSHAAYLQARAALLTHAGGTGQAKRATRGLSRDRRRAIGGLAVGALAAAIAALVTVGQIGGGTGEKARPHSALPGIPAGQVANAADVLDRAAVAAGTRPFTPPRPDQWIYIKEKKTGPKDGPHGPGTSGPLTSAVQESWNRADGQRSASVDAKGKLVIQSLPPGAHMVTPNDYARLATMPTQPQALLAWVDQELGGLGKAAPDSRRDQEFITLSAILRTSVLPPGKEAAVYRAMKIIPGITFSRATLEGHEVLSVGRLSEGWLYAEVLFDPQKFRYVGDRSRAIANHTSKGLDGTFRVKKGAVLGVDVRLADGIVDRPGNRP